MMESAAENLPLIPAPVRYAAAWGEINTRISARSNFNVYHIASIIALAAAHFGISSQEINLRLIPACFMPVVSLIFVMWYRHNDYIIASLSAYCRTFEQFDFKNRCEFAPWFYTPENGTSIQLYVLGFRKWADFATIIICGVSPVLICIDFWLQMSYANLDNKSAIGLYTALLFCVALSASLVLLMSKVADNRTTIITKSGYDPKSGSWTLPTLK